MVAESIELSTVYIAFARNRRSLGREERTLEQYSLAVRNLDSFLERSEGSTNVSALPYPVIEDFMIDYMGKGRAKATANKTFRSLRALFNWAARRKLITYNPFTELSPPKPQPANKHGYTNDQVKQMFLDVRRQMQEPSREGFLACRDHALMLVQYDTGLRATEIINMTVGGLDMDNGIFEVKGKGGKTYRRHLGVVARLAIQNFLMKCAPRFLIGDTSPLWRGWSGVPLTRSGLFRMNQGRAAYAGIKDGGVHRWRYTHAEFLEIEGWPEELIMAEMGHSVLAVNRQYRERAIRARALEYHDKNSPADTLARIS